MCFEFSFVPSHSLKLLYLYWEWGRLPNLHLKIHMSCKYLKHYLLGSLLGEACGSEFLLCNLINFKNLSFNSCSTFRPIIHFLFKWNLSVYSFGSLLFPWLKQTALKFQYSASFDFSFLDLRRSGVVVLL